MFASKQQNFTRNSRLQSTTSGSQRAITPNTLSKKKNTNIHYSQTKHNIPEAPISKQTLLTPINQQIQFDRPYYLGKGNNHEVIRRVLNRRLGWGQATNQQFVYLKWVQTSQSFKFHLLGKEVYCFNHFQYHRELSNKQRLVQNLVNFCQSNKMNAYSFLPVTYIIDLNTGQQDLSVHSFIKFYNRNHPEAQDNPSKRYQTIILPRLKYTPYYTAQQLNKRSQGNFYCKPYCPKTFIDTQNKSYIWILKPTFLNRGRGVALFRTLEQLQKLIWKYFEGQGLQDFQDKVLYPPNDSVLEKKISNTSENHSSMKQISGEIEQSKQQKIEQKVEKNIQENRMANSEPCLLDNQTKQNIQNSLKQSKQSSSLGKSNKQEKEKKSNQKSKILQKQYSSVKPKLQTNNEKNSVAKEQESIQSPTKNNSYQPKCFNFIIQKYIEQPMLIENKKFDIRVWVLLTHTLQVYVFQEAYLRFSSHQYSTKDNHNNPFIHLTNNSVQKYCNEYDKNSGNQTSLSDLRKYITPENKAESIYKSIKNKINDIVWLSMCSVRRKININSRKICFQLFGYDFMVDKDYKTWLIQVNTNPSLDESGPLLKALIPRMVDDMFKLTIDKIFNNKIRQDAEAFSVDGQEDDKNMFEWIGDLKQGSHQRNGKRLTFVRR